MWLRTIPARYECCELTISPLASLPSVPGMLNYTGNAALDTNVEAFIMPTHDGGSIYTESCHFCEVDPQNPLLYVYPSLRFAMWSYQFDSFFSSMLSSSESFSIVRRAIDKVVVHDDIEVGVGGADSIMAQFHNVAFDLVDWDDVMSSLVGFLESLPADRALLPSTLYVVFQKGPHADGSLEFTVRPFSFSLSCRGGNIRHAHTKHCFTNWHFGWRLFLPFSIKQSNKQTNKQTNNDTQGGSRLV